MKIVIETDLGHDSDDLMAILYLISCGHEIPLLIVNPGDIDQIACAYFIKEYLGLEDMIIAGYKSSDKLSSGGIHYDLMNYYNYNYKVKRDCRYTFEDMYNVMSNHKAMTALILGPPKILGGYASQPQANCFEKTTMQGGFVPYSIHCFRDVEKLDKFVGQYSVPTFNMNGARPETETIVTDKYHVMGDKLFVGKNLCHTIGMYLEQFSKFKPRNNQAGKLLHEALKFHFMRHDGKRLHDVVAAIAHTHPEMMTSIPFEPKRMNGGWGVIVNQGRNSSAVDIDREKFWKEFNNDSTRN